VHRSSKTTAKKIAAVIISLLMIALVLFSFIYVVAEADHDCEGEHCQVCECIEICAGILQRFGFKASSSVQLGVAALIPLLAAVILSGTHTETTPVSLKVRLNN
jgi:hypothetical protein